MDKITYFKATSLRMAGFKHHDQPVEYQFGDITVISGGNRVGKTTVADAIAFAITGKGYMGDRFINRFYHMSVCSRTLLKRWTSIHRTKVHLLSTVCLWSTMKNSVRR